MTFLTIAGAGMAGLCAAARARELGLDAVVHEKGDRAGGSMLLSAIVLGPVAWLSERHRPIAWTWEPWTATLYLAVAGSALTFTLYFRLLARRSAATAALVSLTAPVVAVFVGAVTFGEPVTVRTAFGSLVVLLGVGLAARAPAPAS